MTGRDLITGALRLLGALASGEALSSSEASDGLNSLNDLIDSLSNENLLIYTIKEESPISLVAGTAAYTLGVGGNITTRPQNVDGALIRDDTNSPSIDYPLRLLTQREWSRIVQKGTQSKIPSYAYVDGDYPQKTVELYPVPSSTLKLVLFTLRPLSQIASIDATLSFPPGYQRMLKFNLALDLAPEYGRQVDAMVLKGASESKEVIKRANHRPRHLIPDAIPGSTQKTGFNILTGDYNK